MKKLFILFIAVVGFGVGSFAQTAATIDQTGNAGATLIAPITITATGTGLQFGTISKGDVASTVSIDANSGGARNLVTGNAQLVGSTGFNAATFTVTADASQSFIFAVDAYTIIENGADQLNVDLVASTPLQAATQTLYVGGTLTIPALAAAKAYTGTFKVTAIYN